MTRVSGFPARKSGSVSIRFCRSCLASAISSARHTPLSCWSSRSRRAFQVILLRMLSNAMLDALLGAVPIAGNVADIFGRESAESRPTDEARDPATC